MSGSTWNWSNWSERGQNSLSGDCLPQLEIPHGAVEIYGEHVNAYFKLQSDQKAVKTLSKF